MLNVVKNITINLSPEDVKEIIAEHVTKAGYKCEPSDVTLSVGQDCVGYGPMEHQVTVFRGCTVNIKEGVKNV